MADGGAKGKPEAKEDRKGKKGKKVKVPKAKRTKAEKGHSRKAKGLFSTGLLGAKVELYPADRFPNAQRKPESAKAGLQGQKGQIVNVLYEDGRFFYTVLVDGALREVFGEDIKVLSV